MDPAAIERLVGFFGRERFGHLFLKGWHVLVDGIGRPLGLPDYLCERILDHALAEFDGRLDEFRSTVDGRPTVWIVALGWERAHEILRGHGSEPHPDEPLDEAFWRAALREVRRHAGPGAARSIVAALESLPDERHRQLLLLDAAAGGPTRRQIASEATGVSLETVEKERARAREALRTSVERRFPAWADRALAEHPFHPGDRDPSGSEREPLAATVRLALEREGRFPPGGDDERLFAWMRRFDGNPAERALRALWKRFPPPQVVQESAPQPGPLVALAESLYERIDRLQEGLIDHLDGIDARLTRLEGGGGAGGRSVSGGGPHEPANADPAAMAPHRSSGHNPFHPGETGPSSVRGEIRSNDRTVAFPVQTATDPSLPELGALPTPRQEPRPSPASAPRDPSPDPRSPRDPSANAPPRSPETGDRLRCERNEPAGRDADPIQWAPPHAAGPHAPVHREEPTAWDAHRPEAPAGRSGNHDGSERAAAPGPATRPPPPDCSVSADLAA